MKSRPIAIAAALAASLLAMLALRPETEPKPGSEAAAGAAPARRDGAARAAGAWLDPRMLGAPAPAPAPPPVFYGRNGRQVDFGGKDAAAYILERAARARTGDLKAAYDAYQAASGCAAADDPLPDFFSQDELQATERERERVRKLCANVSPAQLQEGMRFLAQLADAGNRDAQIDFYREGPGGKPVDLAARADDVDVRQWKQQALGYLRQAGARCDQFALGLLSNAYDAGQIVERDLASSMAYAIAANQARRQPLTEAQLRQRFGDRLAPADFDAAMQAGAQLAASSCPRS